MNLRAWTIHALLVVAWLTLACSSHHQSQSAVYFVVTGRVAEMLVCQCLNGVDKEVEGYWSPSVADFQKLDVSLRKHFNSFSPALALQLPGYTRQYAGVIKGGRKLIFIGGISKRLGEALFTDLSKE